MTVIDLISQLTCPECGHASVEAMPTDACIYFHECGGCKTLLRPLSGHCCVFCSYGSVPCPPMQLAQPCCRPEGDAAVAQ
ncbi:MAG: GDCCVxC domain-containing (seleno)protein [Steroidobacter sp.]